MINQQLGGQHLDTEDIRKYKETSSKKHYVGKIYSEDEFNSVWTKVLSGELTRFPYRIWQEHENCLTVLSCAITQAREEYDLERKLMKDRKKPPKIFKYPTWTELKIKKLIGMFTGYSAEDKNRIPYFNRSLRDAYIQEGILNQDAINFDYFASIFDLAFPAGDRKMSEEERLRRNIIRDTTFLTILDAGDEGITESIIKNTAISGTSKNRPYGFIWAKKNLVPWHKVTGKTGEQKWTGSKVVQESSDFAKKYGGFSKKLLLEHRRGDLLNALSPYGFTINIMRKRPTVAEYIKL